MVDSVNSTWYQTQIIKDKSNISKISLVKRELMGNINKIEINQKKKEVNFYSSHLAFWHDFILPIKA